MGVERGLEVGDVKRVILHKKWEIKSSDDDETHTREGTHDAQRCHEVTRTALVLEGTT